MILHATLVEAELARHDWKALRDASGSAESIPHALRLLFSAQSPAEADKAYWLLENYVVVQGQLFEAAVAATHVLLAALASPYRPSFVRTGIIELLFQITAGEAHEDEVLRGQSNLGERCRSAARTGLCLLYREMVEEAMTGAIEIIRLIETDNERIQHFEHQYGDMEETWEIEAPIKVRR